MANIQIIIVEDDPIIAEGLKMNLLKMGHEVIASDLANPDFVKRLGARDTSSDADTSPRKVMNAYYFKPPFRVDEKREDLFVARPQCAIFIFHYVLLNGATKTQRFALSVCGT